MKLNQLKCVLGDAINAVVADAAFNFKRRWLNKKPKDVSGFKINVIKYQHNTGLSCKLC